MTPAVRPVAPACGARIDGVDLSRPTPAAIHLVRSALAAHSVVFVSDQHLTPREQVHLTSMFGEVLCVPYIAPLADQPEVIAVLKEADEQSISTFGGTWHSDFSFLVQPPSFTFLQAIDLPDVGGDTIWSSQHAAYEALSSGMRRLLDPMRAIQTGWPHGANGPAADAAVSRSVVMTRNDPSADREVAHPVVRVHPDTGRRALFVNPVYTQRFEEMTIDESAPLLRYLFEHAVRAEFTSAEMDAGHTCDLGQPQHDAPCDQRLRRQPPAASSHHDVR